MFELKALTALVEFGPWAAVVIVTIYAGVMTVRAVLEWLGKKGEVEATMVATASDAMLRHIGRLEHQLDGQQKALNAARGEIRTQSEQLQAQTLELGRLKSEHEACLRETEALNKRLQRVENGKSA